MSRGAELRWAQLARRAWSSLLLKAARGAREGGSTPGAHTAMEGEENLSRLDWGWNRRASTDRGALAGEGG